MKKILFFSALISLLTVQYGCESNREQPVRQEQQEIGPSASEGAPYEFPEHGGEAGNK